MPVSLEGYRANLFNLRFCLFRQRVLSASYATFEHCFYNLSNPMSIKNFCLKKLSLKKPFPYKVKMRITISFILILFGNLSLAQSNKPVKPVTLGEAYELQSAQLSEKRILNIYLPEGYNSADTAKYPVIYLLDGGMDEDFVHIVGLVQFNSFPWIARIPKSIVVGITNKDRKRDFTFATSVKSDKDKYPTTGGSEKFISFIEKELQPFIQSSFKTNNSKTIIGESLGGLLATEILFTKPYLFDKYIIVSPSIWWDNGSILKRQADISDKQMKGKVSIYIGVGKEGLAPSEEPHVMEVDANLLKEKIEGFHNPNINVFFDYLPDENHATIAHQAVFNAFKKLYQK